MAIIVSIHCNVCKKKKNVTVGGADLHPIVCAECRVKQENQDEIAHFARLDGMSVEDRLREMEVWVYKHKKQKHYQPEPRF